MSNGQGLTDCLLYIEEARFILTFVEAPEMCNYMAKVFLSWSGQTSREVATALNRWLPVMLNSIEPFISTEDLRKGGRWASELAEELEQATFAILCVTPKNLQAPWLMFEAGAVSKLISKSQVAPFLFGTKPSDLQGPLAQFNATLNEKEDFHKLLRAINTSSPTQVKEEILARSLDVGWQSLQTDLASIKAEPESTPTSPPAHAAPPADMLASIDPILQEILSHSRQQAQILSSDQFLIAMDRARLRSRTDFPEKDHKVWVDLIEQFEYVVFEGISLDTSVEKLSLLKAIESLRGPIDYIARRLMPEERSRRSSVGGMGSHLRGMISDLEVLLIKKPELGEEGKSTTR